MAAARRRLLLLLLLPALLRPGVAEPEAPGEGRAFTCLSPAPSLSWYLDGEGSGASSSPAAFEESGGGGGGGPVVGTARRLDRRLNCSAVDPATGHESRAAVVLHVQFQPELLPVDGRADEGRGPGLLLVLLVLVQASPPARITWVDADGRRTVDTSHFLIVDAKTYPWLSRRAVEVQLRTWARNDSHAAGRANASALLPGFLDTRIELPLLALLVGAAVTLGVFVGLGTLISCVVYQKGKKAAGLTRPAPLPASDSNHLMPQGPRLPRANMSLPSNLQLNVLTPEPKADGVEDEEGALSEPENSLALENRGLSRFPMVGYIYRASSVSSEEIWL
uniref:transmembrane protein 25 n=1 Tax=Euleptes europaea TaxID=460621 RepID=UPI00253FF3A7|nr:transmembrane protein 25 [Euleptes europaea]